MSKKAAHQYANKTCFLKKTLVFAHIFYITILTIIYLVLISQVNLKKADTTPAFKTDGTFLKKKIQASWHLTYERCIYDQINTKGATGGVL